MYQQENKVVVWCNYIWRADGWKDKIGLMSISDWNQTIAQYINKASADIHRKTMCGGADIIEISPNIEFLFDSLPQYNITNKTFGGRYKVIINDSTSSMIKLYKETNKSLSRVIEVTGLDEPFKDEAPLIKKNYMYLLIKY